jgi:hypothetical protein
MQGTFKMYQILLLPKNVNFVLGFFIFVPTGFVNCTDIEKQIGSLFFVIIIWNFCTQ